MTRLSIAIVSFNVKFYVQQCIEAIQNSTFEEIEIIVVDNNSTDGSADFLQGKYDKAIFLIRNKSNKGFGTACNQALAIAKGQYILFLNPDTIVDKRTLENVIAYAEKTNNLGLLGVRMVNEEGQFLAESKRGTPTPKTSFFRLTGLNRLFSSSQSANEYYAPHLQDHENGKVDVISGAFMLGSAKSLRELGGFDQQFFMYGEDVDLSYRYLQAGYHNHYLGTETIIHHKGKSTNKLTPNYLNRFYGAMSIFHQKHFKDSYSWMFNLLIKIAIFFRKSISGCGLIARHASLPIVELFFFIGGGFLIQQLWGSFYFGDGNYYQGSGANINLILYSLVWILFLIFGSSYRYLKSRAVAINQLVLGFIFILVIYGLLPTQWRSSRALIGLYFLWNVVVTFMVRSLYIRFNKNELELTKSVALVATPDMLDLVKNYEQSQKEKTRDILYIAPTPGTLDQRYTGEFENIISICQSNQLDTVFISMEGFELTEIKSCADALADYNIQLVIIDKHDIKPMLFSHTRQHDLLDSLKVDYKILFWENKIIKRVFDVILSLLLLPISLVHRQLSYSQLVNVLRNKQSLVGYHTEDSSLHKLPSIKTGLIPVTKKRALLNELHKENLNYALQYSVVHDFKSLINFLI